MQIKSTSETGKEHGEQKRLHNNDRKQEQIEQRLVSKQEPKMDFLCDLQPNQ
jgi:hypothetical protein